MDRLTINKFCPSINDELDYKISTIVEIENTNFINNFDANTLLKKRREKVKDKFNKYNKVLNECLRKIMEYDEDNKTDMFYEIKHELSFNINFNYWECINFLQNHLRKKLFDTTIISKKKIFITWKYIELKEKNNDSKTKSINLSNKYSNDKIHDEYDEYSD